MTNKALMYLQTKKVLVFFNPMGLIQKHPILNQNSPFYARFFLRNSQVGQIIPSNQQLQTPHCFIVFKLPTPFLQTMVSCFVLSLCCLRTISLLCRILHPIPFSYLHAFFGIRLSSFFTFLSNPIFISRTALAVLFFLFPKVCFLLELI